MARLFWVGTGVVLTVVVVVKGRQIVHRYAPAAVVDRASASAASTGAALTEAAGHFLADFRAARDERAAQLADALLAQTQGSVEDLRARREAYDSGPGRHSAPAEPTAAEREKATRARYAPLVDDDSDDDELGYSF